MSQFDQTYRGAGSQRFYVQHVDDQWAYGVNHIGKEVKIPLRYVPYKGALPKAGEWWLITRSEGYWVFDRIITAPMPPTITGKESDSTALTNLLVALGDTGLIVDETVKDGGGGGAQGAQGAQGARGYQGYQGLQGPAGGGGTQGAQGFQGTIGQQGYQGSGTQGPQGYQGSASTVQGPQGFQGGAGPQGFQGLVGQQGFQGSTGAQGLTGTGNQGFQGIGYSGVTSTTSFAIGTGSKTFAVASTGAFVIGDRVRVVNTGSSTNWMEGVITGLTANTSIVVNVDVTGGSGTLSAWTITLAGIQGAQGFQGFQGSVGAQGYQGAIGSQGAINTAVSNDPIAAAVGWSSWSFDPSVGATPGTGTTLANNLVQCSKVYLTAGTVVSNVWAFALTTATTTVYAGIYAVNGSGQPSTLLANGSLSNTTANQSVQVPMSAPYTIPTSGTYYLALGNSVAVSWFRGLNVTSSSLNMISWAFGGGFARASTMATTSGVLPSPGTTPTASAPLYWLATN